MCECCNCQQFWKQTRTFTDKTDRWSKYTQVCIYIFKKGEHYDGIIPKPISHNENASPDFTSLQWKNDGVCSYSNICTFLENSRFVTYNQPSMDIENSSTPPKRLHDISVFLQEMIGFRKCNPNNLIVGHLNTNGLRNKFSEIEYMFLQNTLNIFFVSETKLDESFPKHQFNVPWFKSHRADRNSHGGVSWRIYAMIYLIVDVMTLRILSSQPWRP